MQQARYERVIAAATQVLSEGGQEAVQMKDLAQRAGVSLATLYRYFPAKDYLLLAVSLSRYQAAWRLVCAEEPSGDTVRERVTAHLKREFSGRRSRLKGHAGAWIWASWTFLSYNLSTLASIPMRR